jgi:hypothetical protein
MPAVAMKEDLDPRRKLLNIVDGAHIDYEVPDCHVLVATYRRPEKTRGGIVLPASNLDEDLYQSKECLVLLAGHGASFNGQPIEVHQWLVIRPQEAWAMEMIFPKGSLHCRIVYDKYIKGRVLTPGSVW